MPTPQLIRTISTLALLLCCISQPYAKTVQFPLTMDFPLLQSILIEEAFPERNQTATLLNEGDGCIHLALSSPQLREENGLLLVEIRVSSQLGTPIGGCFSPLQWQGYIHLLERPSLSAENWSLTFSTVEARILNLQREQTTITNTLWNLIRPLIWQYFEQVQIDLLPPINDIKEFLYPLFPEEQKEQTQMLLESLRPGGLTIDSTSLQALLKADVIDESVPMAPVEPEQIDKIRLQQIIDSWESWDSLYVYLLTLISQDMISDEEKHLLTTLLLDMRYTFVNDLRNNSIEGDIVRKQFLTAWETLAPLFRNHLLPQSKPADGLGYLAFVASADALALLDQLGPLYNVEISTDGLIRLMEMLNGNPELLHYGIEVDENLRQLFNFEVEEEKSEIIDTQETHNSLFLNIIDLFNVSQAYAKQTIPSFSEILTWKVPESDVEDYLDRVKKVLTDSSSSMITKGKITKDLQPMYQHMILAMAWQESCFRQFIVKGDKLTYLISYNGSSVGLMQINERVWRGLYNLSRLRWDIHYNALAGNEIASYYLNDYALKKGSKEEFDSDTLSRLVYAMYNGGPSQYTKFLKRVEESTFYSSDTLYWEKLKLVNTGELDKASICLIGK